MTTVAEKTARLNALKKARDSGALIVRHGDTSTTFRSLAEIERIIAQLENELASDAGTLNRKVKYIWQPGKGY